MPIFEYKALDANGKTIKGSIDAETAKAAKQKLKKNNLFLTEIREKMSSNSGKSGGGRKTSSSITFLSRVRIQDIALATRQLASLIRANIPLVDALKALIEQTEHEKLQVIFEEVRKDVNEGSSLAKAMAKHPKAFTNVYINMVEAGEQSGTLPLVLQKLADFQESQVRLKGKVTSALMYPCLMMVVAGLLLIGIFTFVIPKIVKIFDSMNKVMPLQTRILIGISNLLINYWYLLIGGALISITLFLRFIHTPAGRRKWDGFLLNVPVLGPILRMVAVARFSSSMSTLLTGGVPIVTAMNIVKNIVDNTLISEAIVQARENVTEGQSIAEPLRRSKQFPPLVIHMIAIGEKTGELPQMLLNVSQTYEEQVSVKIEGLTSLLEPMMIVFMGLVVGGIVSAIFVPLLDLNNIS